MDGCTVGRGRRTRRSHGKATGFLSQDYLTQGLQEGRWDRLTQALAIGSTPFLEKLRRKLTGEAGARTNARAWRRLLPFAAIARAVAEVRVGWKL